MQHVYGRAGAVMAEELDPSLFTVGDTMSVDLVTAPVDLRNSSVPLAADLVRSVTAPCASSPSRDAQKELT